MLIKFLSFAITVIGTTRYKAVFLSCLAVVLSFTGITAFALVRNGQAHDAASKVTQSASHSDSQDSAPQLGGISKQKTKAQDQQSSTETTPQTTTPSQSTAPSNATPSTNNTATTTSPDVVLSKSTATITSGSDSDEALLATISDSSNVSWTITPADGNNSSSVRSFIDQTSATGITFHIHADKNAVAATYKFTVTAKDASRNLSISKIISVTVVSQ